MNMVNLWVVYMTSIIKEGEMSYVRFVILAAAKTLLLKSFRNRRLPPIDVRIHKSRLYNDANFSIKSRYQCMCSNLLRIEILVPH